MRVALGQLNFCVGDIDGNVAQILTAIRSAEQGGAQLLALPELAITGYPPEDLVLKTSFLQANLEGLDAVAAATGEVVMVVGFVESSGSKIYNSAAVCHRGAVRGIYRKRELPNYGVFDERRYFTPGSDDVLFAMGGTVFAPCVCEDIWSAEGAAVTSADAGAQVIVNINASPFHKQKLPQRIEMLAERARRARSAIVYVNLVGGQDELVFDGGSTVVSAEGEVVTVLPQFEETIAIVDVAPGAERESRPFLQPIGLETAALRGLPSGEDHGEARLANITPAQEKEVYDALALAVRDYVRKNGFAKVVIGLSGGIDSSLVATIAADALGPGAVLGVSMPSQFSSTHSVEDAKALAGNLGIDFLEISIRRAYDAYIETLMDAFGGHPFGLAEENLQARVRGTLLMAISNRYGHLVLATGNKSELACGYATLYGDMAGGFAPIKDVFKTEVYRLARYRNSDGPVIPENVLIKPPSAELRPDQKDSDSLPPYELLDRVLALYIEEDLGVAQIAEHGMDAALVERVITLVDRAEYKRRQAPPGPKVTIKAFGRDRRLPISSRWKEGHADLAPKRSVGPPVAESPRD